jgi:GDP-mannose 6-dehydrogenase
MKVSIFGLGYAGCATAVGLAHRGHDVVGVDVNERKVRMINRGESPILESELDAMIRFSTRCGKLRGCSDPARAVCDTDVSLISVESPTKRNGQFDYGYLLNAIWGIGEGLKEKSAYHVVGLRSAVPPGTTESLVVPELEKTSGKSAGKEFAVCVNPEFLRPGSPRDDIVNPAFVIVGSRAGEGLEILQELYQGVGKIVNTQIRTAEMLKYACDALNPRKVASADEIDRISDDLGADARALLHLFGHDANLDLSPVHDRPDPASLGDDRVRWRRGN